MTAAPLYGLGCGGPPPRDLGDLLIRDSTYYEPATMEPYTGPVFRPFDDEPERAELTGTLVEGAWAGELTIYHRNGRVRYQGEMSSGAQCGTWVENASAEPAESVYEEIVAEIQSLSLYPPCPGSS